MLMMDRDILFDRVETRHAQRIYARSARSAIGSLLKQEKGHLVAEKIAAESCYQNAKTVLAYMAMPGELDLQELYRLALLQGKNIAYPVWDGEGGMIAAIADENHMETDRYGAQEPSFVHARIVIPQNIDLVIVPGLGFDAAGYRLGNGSGQYANFLPLCENACKMGVAFAEQVLPRIENGASLSKMDIVVTDQHIHYYDDMAQLISYGD